MEKNKEEILIKLQMSKIDEILVECEYEIEKGEFIFPSTYNIILALNGKVVSEETWERLEKEIDPMPIDGGYGWQFGYSEIGPDCVIITTFYDEDYADQNPIRSWLVLLGGREEKETVDKILESFIEEAISESEKSETSEN